MNAVILDANTLCYKCVNVHATKHVREVCMSVCASILWVGECEMFVECMYEHVCKCISEQFIVYTKNNERVYVHANEHVYTVCMSVCAYVLSIGARNKFVGTCMYVYVCVFVGK